MSDTLKEPALIYDADGNLTSESAILDAIDGYRRLSNEARRSRASKNKIGWDFLHCRQDWSHKLDHQSRDFMPDFPMAVERIAASLSQPYFETEEWFDVVPAGIGPPAIDPVILRRFLMFYMDRLYLPGNYCDSTHCIATFMHDAFEMNIIEAVTCAKVYAVRCNRFQYMLESGNPIGDTSDYSQLEAVVRSVEVPTLRLAIDLIPWEDYFPDPTGNNLFDIHEKSVTLAHLRDNPDYDPEVIDSLSSVSSGTSGDSTPEYEKRRRSDSDDPGNSSLYGPRIREVWGDIVDLRDGKRLLPANRFCTVTSTRKFLRPPTPNPFWHGRRPFCKGSLLRVPLSEVHKSIADHAVPVARAANELDNLMLDGAIAEVWGIRQFRPDLIENAEECDHGIPQGYTAKMKTGAEVGAKFLEIVAEGRVPQLSVEMQRQKAAQFQIATALPETAQGSQPQRSATATEIAAVSASSQGLYGGFSSFFERGFVVPMLELAWMTLWQYVDDFTEPEIVQIVGPERALVLQAMPAAERFVLLAQSIRFRVKGLRQLMLNQELFSRLTVFLQSLGVNPSLLMAYDSKYDIVPYMTDMMKAIRLAPERYEKEPGKGYSIRNNPPPGEVSPAGALRGGTGPGGPTPGTPTSPGTTGTGSLGSEIEGQMAQTNPTGFRGTQL